MGPDPAARALARGRTGAVGVLLTASLRQAFTDDVSIGFLGAVTAELDATGLALTLLSTSSKGDVVPARDAPMDGAVVYACDPDTTAANWLFKRGLPLVTVDHQPVPDVPSVIVDDRGGGRQTAMHVVGLGHRRIGIVAFGNGPEGLADVPTPDAVAGRYIARERLAGYLDVLGPAGVRPVLHTQRRNDEDDARRAVRQDVDAKGKAAAAALLEAMEHARNGPRGRASRVLLTTDLVVRESTGPA